ncbi:MAG: hypothetical protein AB1644_12805 [Candidatus Zixiibacteriota bacterium]
MERNVAILLSRQPLCPTGNSPWVRQSALAVRWVKENSYRLVSSADMQTWELLTTLGSIHQVPLRLIIDGHNTDVNSLSTSVISRFDLQSDLTVLDVLCDVNTPRAKALRMNNRDKAVVDAADLIVPISISPDGDMAKLLEKAAALGKEVCRDFEVPYSFRENPIAYRISPDELNPTVRSIADRYVTHWTRCCHTHWPDERPFDYYRDIANSEEYPRSAIETLKHIVVTGFIRGSTRHMPANLPCVSFSNAPPEELLPLMRWRARYRQMSFEPYGVGIRRDVALRAGIEPVQYVERVERKSGADTKLWLQQTRGRKTDWRREKEYRHRGDFTLKQIAPDDLILFCRTTKEAERLRQSFGLKVIPFVA